MGAAEKTEFFRILLVGLGVAGTLFGAWANVQIGKLRAEKQDLDECLKQKEEERIQAESDRKAAARLAQEQPERFGRRDSDNGASFKDSGARDYDLGDDR